MTKATLDQQIATLDWLDEHIAVVLLGLKSRGVMPAEEVDRLIQGLGSMRGTFQWLQRNEADIKRALLGAPQWQQPTNGIKI